MASLYLWINNSSIAAIVYAHQNPSRGSSFRVHQKYQNLAPKKNWVSQTRPSIIWRVKVGRPSNHPVMFHRSAVLESPIFGNPYGPWSLHGIYGIVIMGIQAGYINSSESSDDHPTIQDHRWLPSWLQVAHGGLCSRVELFHAGHGQWPKEFLVFKNRDLYQAQQLRSLRLVGSQQDLLKTPCWCSRSRNRSVGKRNSNLSRLYIDLYGRCGGFLKWWYPQIIHVTRIFHYKPTILWIPHKKYPFMETPATIATVQLGGLNQLIPGRSRQRSHLHGLGGHRRGGRAHLIGRHVSHQTGLAVLDQAVPDRLDAASATSSSEGHLGDAREGHGTIVR